MKSIRIGKEVDITIGQVSARPSRIIKTPYVCDMILHTEEGDKTETKSVLAHTPSLGCNGMVDKDAMVFAVKRVEDGDVKSKAKCEYGVIASLREEKGRKYVVGVDPSLAERFAGEILSNGIISGLCVKPGTLKTQQTYNDCRFDYCGLTTNNQPFICEVKNTSIAEYENLPPRKLAKMDFSEREFDSKVAIFPSGYKPKGKTHSERALKHTNTLLQIKQSFPEMRCIILFVVQRSDICAFQPTRGDEDYLAAIRNAYSGGVEIYAVSIEWLHDEPSCKIKPTIHNSMLPIRLFDS